MRSTHVRDNRILLVVACSAVFAVVLMASAQLLAEPRDAPLLMSVLAPSQSNVEVAPQSNRAPQVAQATDVEDGHDEPGDAPTSASADEIRWFNGRPVRRAGTMTMLVTAYSPDERSCGMHADGITASGYSVWTNGMRLVAADTKVLPFGSLVSVPDYGEGDGGEIVPVLDRGGKIKGRRLDVLYPTHQIAREWGAQRLEVTIWEYADGKPSGFRTQH